MADGTQHKLVVIQDGTLINMASNPTFVKEFPFLKSLANLAKKKVGCGTCGGGQIRTEPLQAAKRTIAGLPASKKAILKKMLNTRSARVLFKKPEGGVVSLTF